jgi:hypothetical protein
MGSYLIKVFRTQNEELVTQTPQSTGVLSMAELQAHGAQDAEGMATADKPLLANVRQEWDWVKRGIEEIIAEQPQLTFRPEDVYAAVLNGEALLWVAPEGFVITTEECDEFTGAKTFLVWLAWAKERGQSCVIKYYSFFAQAAKEHGFTSIEVRTPVTSLEGYLLAEGWKKDTVIYTREL